MFNNLFKARRLAVVLLLGLTALVISQMAGAQVGAEQAAALRADIDRDEGRLDDLGTELERRNAAFEDISRLRSELEAKTAEVEQQLTSGDTIPEALEELSAQLAALNERVEQERRKAELVFDAMKATRDEIKLVEQKLAKEKSGLAVLLGEEVVELPVDSSPAQESSAPAAATPSSATVSGSSLLSGMLPTEKSPKQTISAPSGKVSLADTAEQIQARKTAEKAAAAALLAERDLNEFVERKQNLEEQIRLEQEQLRLAENALVILREEQETVQREVVRRLAAGEAVAELSEGQARLEFLNESLIEIGEQVEARSARLARLTSRLDTFAATQDGIVAEVEGTRAAAESAREQLIWANSPLNPTNIMHWARVRGTGLLLVIGMMLALLWLVRFSARRIIRLLVRSAQSDRAVRSHRADTLAASLGGVVTGVVFIFAVMVVLQEAGVDLATVLGGAAILGVAVAFGAQNLMRDYFNGVMILLEDQYGLDDLVTIDQVEGRIERVNMRTTVIRDIQGRLHFIPNGQITHVTNRSYEWSRALFDVPVPYSCDVDQVMAILMDEAQKFCEDMDYTSSVSDKPEMLGVNEFAESSIIIRFFIKTAANMHMPVKREMLRRIKNRFDKEGISIPFPHRVIISGDK